MQINILADKSVKTKVSPYKVGDFVDLHDSSALTSETVVLLPDDFELPYKTCDVTLPMLLELNRWEDNQIASIDSDGDFKFEDIPYTWPIEVIKGLSKDQRLED